MYASQRSSSAGSHIFPHSEGIASAPVNGARHHRHAVTSAARTRIAKPNRARSEHRHPGTVNEPHQPHQEGALRRTHWARALAGRAGAGGRRPRPAVSAKLVLIPIRRRSQGPSTVERSDLPRCGSVLVCARIADALSWVLEEPERSLTRVLVEPV